jgi:hypothetical protein
MNEEKLKACPFCGSEESERDGTNGTQHKDDCYIILMETELPNSPLRIMAWNRRAGDRQPVASETVGVKALASATGYAAALERAITALTYRADTLEESITKRPGAAIARILADGLKNDRLAIADLNAMLRHNDQAHPQPGAAVVERNQNNQ